MKVKQKGNTGDHSTIVQVSGDLNTGLNYEEVCKVFLDLFELNFPKIQEIAAKTAYKRVNDYLESLFDLLKNNKDRIDSKKFIDPAVQFEMQSIIINVAKRGENSNKDLLNEVLINLVNKECSDIIEMISGETLKIIPFLNKKHLAYLSLVTLARDVQYPSNDLIKLNKSIEDVGPEIISALDNERTDLFYLTSIGAIEKLETYKLNFAPDYILNFPEFRGKRINKIIKILLKRELKSLIAFIDIINKTDVGYFKNTTMGMLIGMLNIKHHLKIENVGDFFINKFLQ